MEINNIIKSADFLEFVNNLDELVLDILYNQNTGYINLTSKMAINEAQNKLKEFDDNTRKLIEESGLDDVSGVIEEKREELIGVIKKHYENQVFIWCDEIYKNCIENCKISIAINRDDIKASDKEFQKVLNMISWISNVKQLSSDEEHILFEQFNKELDKMIKSNTFELLKNKTKSNENKFLEFFYKIDDEEFLKIDFNKENESLTKDDINYFKQIQQSLISFKSTSVKDEFNLLKNALQILNLNNAKEKYDFLKEVLNDFISFKIENKKLTNEDKISLVKRRISIFKDKSNYFKNQIKQDKN